MAIVFDTQGKYDKAVEYNEKCLGVLLRELGPNDLRVAKTRGMFLAIWQSIRKRWK